MRVGERYTSGPTRSCLSRLITQPDAIPHDVIDTRTRELVPEINNPLADSIRAHRELNTLCRSKVTGQGLIERLLRIVRDDNLEE
jgi:hypothetical protein